MKIKQLLVISLFLQVLLSTLTTNCGAESNSSGSNVNSTKNEELSHNLVFQRVIQVPKIKKSDLYRSGIKWFAYTFRSGKDVIQTQDLENGILIGKALFVYEPSILQTSNRTRGTVHYTITLEFKDERCRYTLESFIHEGNPMASSGPISFGLLTNDQKCPKEIPGPFSFGLTSSARDEVWEELKRKAAEEAQRISSSLEKSLLSSGSNNSDW